jgi:hypothetical protein
MKTKLYELHKAFSKHAGVYCDVIAVAENREQGLVYYCTACKGFYVVVGQAQYQVHKADNKICGGLIPHLRAWRTYAKYIGQRPYRIERWDKTIRTS